MWSSSAVVSVVAVLVYMIVPKQMGTRMNTLDVAAGSGLELVPKIVGGSRAEKERYKYAVSIHRAHEELHLHVCGGTLVAANLILTAASCLEDIRTFPARYRVSIGKYDLRSTEEAAEEFEILEIQSHPSYDPGTGHYDMALVRLYGQSKYPPVVVYKAENEESSLDKLGQTGTVIGWGRESWFAKAPSRYQRKLFVKIVECPSRPRNLQKHQSRMCVLALKSQGRISAPWKGDIGGPLIVQNPVTKQDMIIGVASAAWNPLISIFRRTPAAYSKASQAFKDGWLSREVAREIPADMKPPAKEELPKDALPRETLTQSMSGPVIFFMPFFLTFNSLQILRNLFMGQGFIVFIRLLFFFVQASIWLFALNV